MSDNIITLNCENFFTYFAFHPQDARLSKKDRKVATIATIAFAFSIVGHAVCRLFFYKKNLFTQAKDKTHAVGEKRLRQKADSDKAPKPKVSTVVQLKDTSKVISLPKAGVTDNEPQAGSPSLRQVSNVGTLNPAKPKVSKIVPFPPIKAMPQPQLVSADDSAFGESRPQKEEPAFEGEMPPLQPLAAAISDREISQSSPTPQSKPIKEKDSSESPQPNVSPKQKKIVSLAEAKSKLQLELKPAKKPSRKRFVLRELIKASSPNKPVRQGTISEEQMAGCNLCSEETFKQIRLIDWEDAKSDYPNLDKQVQRRIRELDKIIHFSHRIRSLEDKTHLELLTMDDLQQPLLDSALDLAISSTEELGSVYPEAFNDAQLAMVKSRLPSLKTIEIKDVRKLPKPLTVQQLHSLNGQQLSKLIDEMPINCAKLISDEQFAEMEFSLLKKGQEPLLNVLLQGRTLDVRQFISCYRLLTDEQKKLFVLDELTESQIKTISFSNLDLGVIKQILSSKEKMAWLNKDQLRSCWSTLDNEWVTLVSTKQIEQMDGNFTMDIHKFDALCPVVKGDKPWETSNIQYLKLVQIFIHGNFFNDHHLKCLTPNQIRELDFNQGLGLRVLEKVILQKGSVGEERLKEIFEKLKSEQQEIVKSRMKRKLYKKISSSESATV